MRSVIEGMSGVTTGSDINGHVPGESGEKVTDNRVFAIKTHWPNRPGPTGYPVEQGKWPPVLTERNYSLRTLSIFSAAIVPMRSPFDSIISFWNLMVGGSHTKTLSTKHFTSTPRHWFVRLQVFLKVASLCCYIETCINLYVVALLVFRFQHAITMPWTVAGIR
jgi:hypothetical protein